MGHLPLLAGQELLHLVLGQALGVAGVCAVRRRNPGVGQSLLGREAPPGMGSDMHLVSMAESGGPNGTISIYTER